MITAIRRHKLLTLVLLLAAIAATVALPKCEGKGSHPFQQAPG